MRRIPSFRSIASRARVEAAESEGSGHGIADAGSSARSTLRERTKLGRPAVEAEAAAFSSSASCSLLPAVRAVAGRRGCDGHAGR